MKAFLMILLLAFGLNSYAQDTLANVVIHTWAGGQCCASGTDITMVLSPGFAKSDFDSLVYVSSSGYLISLRPNDFHAVNSPQKSSCTLTFGWSSMRYGDDRYPGTSSYYGLPASRFRPAHGETPQLRVYSNKRLIGEGKVSEQFTMTAYP